MTIDARPDRLWWSTAELAEARLPDMPNTRQGIDKVAARDGWAADPQRARRRSGRGGGWEYHWTLLPERARMRLTREAVASAPPPQPTEAERGAQHDAYDALPAKAKAKAEARLAMLDEVAALVTAGFGKNAAVGLVASRQRVAARSIWNWFEMVEGLGRLDWLPALAPRHRRGAGKTRAEIPTRFMELFKADYMRLEAPSLTSAYRRTVRLAEAERLSAIPPEHLVRRRLRRDVPEATLIYAREGLAGLQRCYPPQVRDRTGLVAMEAVNADCHKIDTFVEWPNGTIDRPQIIAFQDLHSGRILSWRVDHSPNKVMVMAAFADMIREYGIPKHCLFDNGTEFANKWLTGGAPTRFRFKVRDDDPLGALTMLGIKIHWATPGHGQAKPVERTFLDWAEDVAKDPRFAGAYVGRRPDAKPENYGSTAVPLDEFVAVLDELVAEHNARTGRRSPTCAGRSFDETFAASYAQAAVAKATEAQLRTCLLAQQTLTPDPKSGRIRMMGNYYYAPWLFDVRGQKVAARFDPEDLHAGLHVYALDGRFLGEIPVQEAVGFFDVTEAQATARRKRAIRKAEQNLLRATRPLEVGDVAEGLRALAPRDGPSPEAKVVEGRFGDRHGARGLPPAPSAPPAREESAEDRARHAAFVADFEAAKARKVEAEREEDARDRFTRAIHLTRAAEAGDRIGEAEAAWLKSYRSSPEWRAQLRMFETYGDAMLAK